MSTDNHAAVLAGGYGSVRAACITAGTAALFVSVAAADGGYFPTSAGWLLLGLSWAALAALVVRPEAAIGRLELAVAGLLAALAGWSLATGVWSGSWTEAVPEAHRTLVYALAAFAAALWLDRRSYPALAGGLWLAITLVAVYSLATRLLPERLGVFDPFAGYRLSEPVGYWNALGIFAGIGVLLALGFAARPGSPFLRAAAAASVVVLVPTIYFTFSRGAWITLGLAILAAVAFDPTRLRLLLAIAISGPWAAIAILVASSSPALTRSNATLLAATRDGHFLGTAIIGLGLAAAASALVAASREKSLDAFARRWSGKSGLVLAVAVAGVAVGVSVEAGGPHRLAEDAWDRFSAPPVILGADADLEGRLFSLSGNGRVDNWDVALNRSDGDLWIGAGAGSFERAWLAERDITLDVKDAHSLYLETLSELGAVGLGLLALALTLPLVAAWRARRSALVPALLGAYVAFLVHAGVDWDWEMPAVTLAGIGVAIAICVAARGEEAVALAGPPRRAGIALLGAVSAGAVALLIGITSLDASREALAARDLEEADRKVRRAAALQPWSIEPSLTRAEVFLRRGERDRARRLLIDAAEREPESWRVWVKLAEASDGPARRRALDRARALNPFEKLTSETQGTSTP